MPQVQHYIRPTQLAEALQLLAQPGTVALAGGTQLIAGAKTLETVVDLQALGLDQIVVQDDTILLEGMARLQSLVDHPDLPPVLRAMAQREGPNTFRHMSTVGGTVAAADPESELFAALLAFEAMVTIESLAGRSSFPLAAARRLAAGELITAVSIRADGQAAAERVSRTPADKPILAVIGRRDATGVTHLALCGVAPRPILATLDELAALDPPADFRGSAEYRRYLAVLLSQRVLQALTTE